MQFAREGPRVLELRVQALAVRESLTQPMRGRSPCSPLGGPPPSSKPESPTRVGECEGVVVKRVHTLLGGVHRLATALKDVEEVREEVQEIKDEWEDQEDEENGGLKVEEKRSSHAWMR